MKNDFPRKLIVILLLLSLLISGCEKLNTPAPIHVTELPPSSETPTNLPTTPVTIEDTPEREPVFMEADRVLSFGDFSEAIRLYQQLPLDASDELKAASIYGIGLAYYKQKDFFQASKHFEELNRLYPDSLPAIRSNFIQALIHLEQEQEEAALDYYLAYREKRPGILDADVNLRIGNLFYQQSKLTEAQEAYRQSYLAPQRALNTSVALKLAATYQELGQPDLALGIYKETLHNSESDYTKSAMNLLIGRILIDQGNPEEAYTYFQDSVEHYPQTYDAYTALVTLLEADQPVDELKRGMINYYVEQYHLAIEALDRYLESDGYDKDEALYYKGLSLRAKGLVLAGFNSVERNAANASGGTSEDKQAIQTWNQLLNTYPESIYRKDAIEDIIYTQNAYMGQMKLAIETTLAFVAMPHIQSEAAGLLETAAGYYLLDGQTRAAADTWTRIGLEFPTSTEAFNGLFFGGTLYYELKEYGKAADNFNRAVLLASLDTLEVAASYFWLGKVAQAQGDVSSARSYWQTAIDSEPYGYYGIRAAELLNGKPPFSSPVKTDFEVNLDEERLDAGDWLKTAFSLPPQTNLEYSSELFEDSRYVRGLEYHQLGLYDEASQEFESLRDEYKDDPLNSFRLMKEFLDLGYYQSAIETSRSISRLAGYGDIPLSANFPPYFAHVQYGTYYLPWVETVAEKHGLSPLLIFSLIYQESHFAAHAYSSAGASGLMQLMPATAAQIAGEIGYPPNYEQSDLAIPLYNLELGSNYLARQMYVFEGNPYHALAAYNGGPGNTLKWKELTEGDLDVFLNSIRFLETRTYLRRIVEIYHIYSLIYAGE